MHLNPAAMRAATALTRSGRLAEATALIQRLLRGHPPARPGDAHEPPTIDGVAERLDDAPEPQGTVPGARSRLLARVHRGRNGELAYRLFVPGGRATAGMPLLVMLHGCTQAPEDFMAGTRMNEFAAEHGFLVAWPEQPERSNPNRCWNWFSPRHQRRERGEPARLAAMAREVVAEFGADPARVFAAGLSAGGAAAAILAETHPDLFAAVGVHSGLAPGVAHDVPSAFAAMREGGTPRMPPPARVAPMIVLHGDADPVVSPVNGEQLAARAVSVLGPGASAERQEGRSGGRSFSRTLHRDAAGRLRVDHWSIRGGGHAWSGGSASGSHADPSGPDASRAILRFFRSVTGAG